jgi:DNA helicase-2/ATP-dependent DNA helicase PcrA
MRAYKALLDQKDYLDYSSILEEAVGALASDAGLRDRIGTRVRYVIVDEYQDVNPIQECIVKLLHGLGATICVVGDDDQTIYQWRGSNVRNILTFETRYPKPKQIRLEENFRSSPGIVETARDFISQNHERLPKAMKPTDTQACEAGDIVALAFDDPDVESRYVVSTIKSLSGVAFKEDGTERGLAWSDMAVLLRSVRNSAEPITTALTAAGIPFVVGGMNNLFSRPEAEASRQIFYFISDRIDEKTLAEAWESR